MEYRDCEGLHEGGKIEILVNAPEKGGVEIYAGETIIASWCGTTKSFEKISLISLNVLKEEQTVILKLAGKI